MEKLVYLFEEKEEVNKNRWKPISPFYFWGLYAENDQNATLWEEVDAYIWNTFDCAEEPSGRYGLSFCGKSASMV